MTAEVDECSTVHFLERFGLNYVYDAIQSGSNIMIGSCDWLMIGHGGYRAVGIRKWSSTSQSPLCRLWLQMTQPAQRWQWLNPGYFGYIFVQQKKVEMHGPPLYTVTGIAAHFLKNLIDFLLMNLLSNLRVDWQQSLPQPRQKQSI